MKWNWQKYRQFRANSFIGDTIAFYLNLMKTRTSLSCTQKKHHYQREIVWWKYERPVDPTAKKQCRSTGSQRKRPQRVARPASGFPMSSRTDETLSRLSGRNFPSAISNRLVRRNWMVETTRNFPIAICNSVQEAAVGDKMTRRHFSFSPGDRTLHLCDLTPNVHHFLETISRCFFSKNLACNHLACSRSDVVQPLPWCSLRRHIRFRCGHIGSDRSSAVYT